MAVAHFQQLPPMGGNNRGLYVYADVFCKYFNKFSDFQHEFEALSFLANVKGVPTLLKTNPKKMYIAMKRCPIDLFDLVQSGAVDRRQAWKIAGDIARTLQECLALNLCHLDLKPENIGIGPEGEALLLDWGNWDFAHGTGGGRRGTPLYMAPEMFRAEAFSPPAADVFSLGVVLYVMLTGLPLFQEFPCDAKFADVLDRLAIVDAADARVLARMLDFNPATRLTLAEFLRVERLELER